jgi:hypothetical protein
MCPLVSKTMDGRVPDRFRRVSHLLALSLLLLGVCLFFGNVLFSRETLFGNDFVLQFHPWKKFLYEHFKQEGSIPFWNPYVFSGIPFVANIQASLFYPLGFLYYLLPPERAYVYSTVLHCMLGAGFMYLFMRSLAVSVLGCVLSSLVFTYNGYFMAHLYAGHLSFVQSYIWVPLIFLLQQRSFDRIDGRTWILVTGLVLGVQILGGFPQVSFYTILALVARGLHHFFPKVRTMEVREGILAAGRIALPVVLGFLTAAVQVLPTAELARLSTRAGGLSYLFATDDSLQPWDLIAVLLPDIFGNVVDGTYWGSVEAWHFWESCAYLGVLPLALLLLAKGRGPQRSLQLFFAVVAFSALFIALGKYNPLYPLFYHCMGFRYFRIPAQILFLFIFSISVLTGMRLDLAPGMWSRWRKAIQWILVVILVGGYLVFLSGLHWGGFAFLSGLQRLAIDSVSSSFDLQKAYGRALLSGERVTLFLCLFLAILLLRRANRIRFPVYAVLCIAIAAVDLWSFSRPFVKPYTLTGSRAKESLVAGLSRDPVQGRVLAAVPEFHANDGLTYGFPSLLGYDPLNIRRYIRFIQASQDEPPGDETVQISRLNKPFSPLLRQLNLRQIASDGRIIDMQREGAYGTFSAGAVLLEPERILSYLKSPDFKPEEVVVLEPDYAGEFPVPPPGGRLEADWKIVHYANDAIRLKVSVGHPCFLVLSEVFYPGWIAEVDGERSPLLRGNYLFRVLKLEQGEHDVFLRFVSWPFRIGLVISLMTLGFTVYSVFTGKKSV